MITSGSFSFRLISHNDAVSLQPLYKAVYGCNPPAAYYKTKLQPSPHSPIAVAAVDDDSGAIVALNVFYRRVLRFQGKNFLAAVPGDLMTHPAYRNRGLAAQCAEAGFEAARKEGVQFFFNFGNRNTSVPQMQKLGWDCSRDVFELRADVFSFPFARAAARLPWLQNSFHCLCRYIIRQRFAESIPFQNSEIVRGGNGLLRDETFFGYRTYTQTHFVASGPFRFWLRADGDLKVGDIAYLPDANGAEALHALKQIARSLGCSRVVFIGTEGSWAYRLLAPFMTCRPVQKVCQYATDPAIDASAIHFHWGDTDSF